MQKTSKEKLNLKISIRAYVVARRTPLVDWHRSNKNTKETSQ